MTNDLTNIIAGLDDDGLERLEAAVQEQREARQRPIQLEDIKAGMTPAQFKKAHAEVAKALRELRA